MNNGIAEGGNEYGPRDRQLTGGVAWVTVSKNNMYEGFLDSSITTLALGSRQSRGSLRNTNVFATYTEKTVSDGIRWGCGHSSSLLILFHSISDAHFHFNAHGHALPLHF